MTTVTSIVGRDQADIRLRQIQRDNGGALLHFLQGLLSSTAVHTAEDLVQETLLRAWRTIDSVPVEPESQRRWLFTVARRLAIDAYRKRQSRPTEVGLTGTEPGTATSEAAETVIALLALRHAVNELSPAHRSVLRELHFEGRSFDQVATRLGIPVGTVKSRAHYAMRQLRDELSAR
ncbi:sigma-70 family RNA polymerase sigma factor [Paractinoplanes brasiliensis]|uniref:RNA polymerase sigma-70 factor (ECF subfamily) n=1 Tax=Paractinoplanes brasiliensis TaxID=52695 RepID=A0A4V3C7B7_9ACTN|nr:sigma-70 family RNA polymerase sigma factor [Actinoplanes brasiliensis]TDO37058.1 RNA polymerase sigma-70 factor (ECF subfamily) [Actinoplanes brasiliensis]GID32248.1 RNA polymerase sigma factor SigL [Actinoplanes brasiliensis]